MQFLLSPSIVKRLSWESVKQNIEEICKDENNPDWNVAETVNRYYALPDNNGRGWIQFSNSSVLWKNWRRQSASSERLER